VVVAGAIFTIPALYILDLKPSFVQIFLSCLVGGYLGVVLLIPLRRYFVKTSTVSSRSRRARPSPTCLPPARGRKARPARCS